VQPEISSNQVFRVRVIEDLVLYVTNPHVGQAREPIDCHNYAFLIFDVKVIAFTQKTLFAAAGAVKATKEMKKINCALKVKGVIPSFEEVNRELMKRKDDKGMGGGMEWKPFTISDAEDAELREGFTINPALRLKA